MKKKVLRKFTIIFTIIFIISSVGTFFTSAHTDTEAISDELLSSQELVAEDNSLSGEEASSGIEIQAANSAVTSGAVYCIKNAASGKYVNVHNGIDATGTNVYQWTADGSAEQKFKIVYSSADDAYKFYCMCSSNGTNRVLDIKRDDAAVASGQNVQICGPVDPTAQNWTIVSLGSNKYKICVKANTALALTSYGNSNGTSTGTSATSAGNVFISTYTGAQNQMWYLEKEGTTSTVKPTGWLDSVSTSKISGWAWRSDIPDTPIDVHIYVTNTSSEKQWFYPVTASTYRADLKNAGYGNGNHAFSSPINWLTFPAGTYQVDAYGIGANNPSLSGSPKTYTVRNMTGNIEYLDENGIGGWAWKPDAPDASISIHIYVYKSDGTRVGFYVASASQPRSDLQSLGYGNGKHGFSYAIPWDTLPEENLSVIVYMVDGSGYHPSFGGSPRIYANGTASTNYVWPTVSKRITQNYANTSHTGIDIGAVTPGVAGDNIYAFTNGQVTYNVNHPSYGNVIFINHVNPKPSISSYLQTRYAHMVSQSSLSVGASVVTSQIVGYMGTSGQSTGVHLHFETREATSLSQVSISQEYLINPFEYFTTSGEIKNSIGEVVQTASTEDSISDDKLVVDYYFDINDEETEPYNVK